MTDRRVNALGGGLNQYTEDKRAEAICEALLDHLDEHPELHGTPCAPGELMGFLMVPIAVRDTPEGRISSSGLMTFARKGVGIPTNTYAQSLHEAGLMWYAALNGDRVNTLDAYVAGDVSADELEGLLGEPLDRTRQALGLAYLPLNRDQLGVLLASIRAKLAE